MSRPLKAGLLRLALAAALCSASAADAQGPAPAGEAAPLPERNPLVERIDGAFSLAPDAPAAEAILRHIARIPPSPGTLSYAADPPAAAPRPDAAINSRAGAAHSIAIPIPPEKPADRIRPPRDPADPAPTAEANPFAPVPAPQKKPEPPPRRTRIAAVAVPVVPAAVAVPDKPAEAPAACLAALKQAQVEYAALPAIASGSCGAETPLRVTKIAGIALEPPATLRCPTARAAAAWVAEGLKPAAAKLGSEPAQIMVAASYACRTRVTGRGGSSILSEHARANALDVRAVRLADGREVAIMPQGSRAEELDAFQAEIRAAGCGVFKTVLGPGADPAHVNHLHFDLAERRRGGVVCR